MKTAVSIPDDVFLAAEKLARHLVRHSPEKVTEAMNGVVDRLPKPTDPFVSAAGRRALGRTEW